MKWLNRQEYRQPNDIPLLDIHPYYGEAARAARGRNRLFLALLPIHTSVMVRWELHMAWLRLRARNLHHRFDSAHNLLVNLGAGDQGLEGWVNVDAVDAPGVTCVCDCRKRLPFPDSSVLGIFTEHFFEHLDYTEEVPYFLSECHRVLQHEGVLRIIVPDAGQYLAAYCAGEWRGLAEMRGLQGRYDPFMRTEYHTRIELINSVFRQGHEHKYAYDYETLDFLLDKYGFVSITQQYPETTMLTGLNIDHSRRSAESLRVEAVKI